MIVLGRICHLALRWGAPLLGVMLYGVSLCPAHAGSVVGHPGHPRAPAGVAREQNGEQNEEQDEAPIELRPSWLEHYDLWKGRSGLASPNDSYLQNRKTNLVYDPLVGQIDSLIDRNQAAAWRQQFEDINRDYDQKQRAGLVNPTIEQAHEGAVSGFSNGVRDDIENRKMREAGDKAAQVVQKDKTVQAVMAPGAVVAGVYVGVWIGKSVNLRVSDDTHFSFRTSMRDKTGQIELHSPLCYSSFEYHQLAADNYNLIAPAGVDFGRALDFNHIVDFQSEKYQVKVARMVPYVDLNSSVLYGSSSNVLASSLSKQLTPHLAAVVDSLYYLTPYDPDHTLEERVRLRYDIRF